jgi:hypothetical protein
LTAAAAAKITGVCTALLLRQYPLVDTVPHVTDNSELISKRRFCQRGRHPKIGVTNFGGILQHSARIRKQNTYVLSYVLKIDTN